LVPILGWLKTTLRPLRGVHHDSLLTNSFFLASNTVAMGVSGFVFWVVAARLFHPDVVGLATTVITAAGLISFAGQCGFNTTFVAVLPTATEPNSIMNTGVLITFCVAGAIAAGYAVVVPVFAPKLVFLRSDAWYFLSFVLFTGFIAVNSVTDSVFIAFRNAKYNLLIDGVIQGVAKLLFLVAVISLGAIGIFVSYGAGAFIAVAVSLGLMARLFRYRPRVRLTLRPMAGVLRYSAVNYVANIFSFVPTFLVPLLILSGLGAASVGFFYVSLQVVTMLYGAEGALCLSLFAEGSQRDADVRRLAVRTGVTLLGVVLPGIAVVAGGSAVILGVFGPIYRQRATALLVVLAIGALPVALNLWTIYLLRLRRQLGALIMTSAIYAAGVCVPAALWRHRPLVWVGVAWFIGNALSGLAGVVALRYLQQPTWRDTTAT
jgi:O-antigen/teichoic acid export membrane protein